MALPEYAKNVMGKYARWLDRRYYDTYARRWAQLCHNDIEAGAMEAIAWAILCANDVKVKPHDDTADGKAKPDFVCRKGTSLFYAEATCMKTENVAAETGLPAEFDPNSGARCFGLLTNLVFNEVRGKTAQCSGLGAPCILMVGTFHGHASCVCVQEHFMEELLTGKGGISIAFDTVRGEAVGDFWESTKLESSVFIRPGGEELIEHARCPISAVLVCGLGCDPPNVYGALHPAPAHAFDPQLLVAVPFCMLDEGYTAGSLSVSWVQTRRA